MPQNLIWLVKSVRRRADDPSARPAPEPRRPRSSHTAFASPREIGCRAAKRSPRLQCADTLGVPIFDGGDQIQPQPSCHREHPNAIGAPHGRGMSDDLTHGDCRHGGRSDGREQIVLGRPGNPLAGNPDVATDPSRAGDLAADLALPGRCLQVGFESPPAAPGPRIAGFEVPDALPAFVGVLAVSVMA